MNLAVFPNPFNAEAEIHLTTPVPGTYAMVLYNLTGQRVAELWSGEVTGFREIRLDARGLTSGIYFVRAMRDGFSAPAATAKVILLR